ncbi:hypothetical protein [Apilactobacillus ozensis]|nr:hypothetical protein [Apilactobacillus ozensis]
MIREHISEDKKAGMDMLLDQIQSNYDKLDELNWELSMIKEKEDE